MSTIDIHTNHTLSHDEALTAADGSDHKPARCFMDR